MSRVYFLMVLIGLFPFGLKAQGSYYSTRNYTVHSGLPQSQVSSLLEDKSGYLWVGTHGGGLARFDGREFKVYNTLDGLLSNQIVSTYLDSHNILWILHPRGITKFNGREFRKIQPPDAGSRSPRFMWRMFNIRDTVFVLSARDRISKLHGDSIYYWEKPLPRELKRMHVGPRGEICFYLDDDSFLIRHDTITFSFKPEIPPHGVFNFFNYRNDILFRSKDGVYKLDLANRSISTTQLSIPNAVFLYDEKDDVLWTANMAGIIRGKLKSGSFVGDTILRQMEISQILRDAEGNTWIATNGYGLYKHFVQDFRRYSHEPVRGAMAVRKDNNGSVWAGTMYNGVWKLDGENQENFTDRDQPMRNHINCIEISPDNEVWIGSGLGLGRYRRESNSFQWYGAKEGLVGTAVMCIEFDDRGMWVGTNNGLNYYDGKSFINFREHEGLIGTRILAMHHSATMQALYIATPTSLMVYKDNAFSTVPLPELVNASILSIHSYRDSTLLMATAGAGVGLLNVYTNKRKLLTTRDGLASDFIYFAGADDKNYLWIGTEKGINKVRVDKKWEVVENLHYNDDNGLAGVETNQNAFYMTPTEKYFGVVDGVYEFNHALDDNATSFDLHLSDIQILYGEYSSRDYADSTFGFFRIPYHPQFPPDKNHLTFQFNRVDKQYSKSVKYKYFLENFDAKWSQPSSVNSVTYGNLPPGDYIFKAMVTDNKGSWDASAIEYPFTIKAPFYKTTAFIVAIFILIGGMVTLIFYIRVKQRINRAVVMERIRQREQEAVRKEIARDFHDEMGNQLTRIINYISLLKLNGNGHVNGNGKNTSDLYTKVEDSAKYLYSGTRDFIWSIDPVNDELSKLFLHIRDFGEKLFEEKQIDFRAFNDVKDSVTLPYGFCRQANLIFKEAMTNAFKYSQAKNVSLSLKRNENEGFEMILEDDGVGFYTGDTEKMNGLKNIRERADRIGAVLRIHSEKSRGTIILLKFKLTKKIKYGAAV